MTLQLPSSDRQRVSSVNDFDAAAHNVPYNKSPTNTRLHVDHKHSSNWFFLILDDDPSNNFFVFGNIGSQSADFKLVAVGVK